MRVFDFFSNRNLQDEVAKLQLLLEKPGNGVMFFNANLMVSRVNQSAAELFRQHRQVFEQVMPDFDSQHLVGTSLDNFTAIPAHVFSDLRKQHKSWSNIMSLGEEKFHVSLLPLIDEQGIFKGGIFEFYCVTEQLKQDAEADRSKSVLHQYGQNDDNNDQFNQGEAF